jgi:hypothetical protein
MSMEEETSGSTRPDPPSFSYPSPSARPFVPMESTSNRPAPLDADATMSDADPLNIHPDPAPLPLVDVSTTTATVASDLALVSSSSTVASDLALVSSSSTEAPAPAPAPTLPPTSHPPIRLMNEVALMRRRKPKRTLCTESQTDLVLRQDESDLTEELTEDPLPETSPAKKQRQTITTTETVDSPASDL